MRPVVIRVTGTRTGKSALLTSFYHRPKRQLYRVPLYEVIITGRTKNNSPVTETFEAIRFGVHRTHTTNAKIVGLAEAQTHTLSWDTISTMGNEEAWRVYDGFFIHRGPDYPLKDQFGSIGCVEICGVGEWDRFNDTIKRLAGTNDLFRAGNSNLVTAEYEAAVRPPLKKI